MKDVYSKGDSIICKKEIDLLKLYEDIVEDEDGWHILEENRGGWLDVSADLIDTLAERLMEILKYDLNVTRYFWMDDGIGMHRDTWMDTIIEADAKPGTYIIARKVSDKKAHKLALKALPKEVWKVVRPH